MRTAVRNVNLRVLATVTWLVLSTSAGGAQAASIAGRVEILDRKGAATDVDEALVWLEGAGMGSVPARRAEIPTEDKAFLPRVSIVPVGSAVGFPNHDPFDHNVFSTSAPKSFDLGLYGRNQARSVTFEQPGIVRLYCNVHAKMSAVILVQPSPYATRVDKGGRFRFEGVPAGRYTLRVWHERGGERTVAVSVPSEAPLAVTLDARNYTFVQHMDKNGKPYDARGRRY
jgi:plastocyanin